MFVDLDGFKSVNDTLSHDASDYVLKETANRLSSCVRDVDTVARIGGDEFWVFLTDIANKNDVIIVVEKLIKALTNPYKLEREEISVSGSIGIALYPDHEVSPKELINLADQAMYEIKRQGKNNYAFSEEIAH